MLHPRVTAPLPSRGPLLLLLLLLLSVSDILCQHTNRFAFCLGRSDDPAAETIARQLGFGPPHPVVENCYEVEHSSVVKRSLQPSDHHVQSLLSSEGVVFAEQQVAKRRTKRDAIHRNYRAPPYTRTPIYLNDPRWMQMWYLNRGGRLDMNVQEAWRLGHTGRGVVVTILDDGLEKDHPDIKDNYDPMASFDVNDRDSDPQPRYDLAHTNRHGTRCAGEVAAIANNSICGVGIAFHSNIGGVRMLDGEVTDAVEARSLSLNPQHIDIYSASWGPDDDGSTVDGPGELAKRAFKDGIVHGRGGKGSIFVWASGNGGREKDNCNCDGYTNSMWTLSISSATEYGHVPWYSEACSSTLATTYSSGSSEESKIVTTDLQNGCTTKHTGTSASAPLAAGICALALEANPELSWRDMQHIVVRTAHKANLQASDWTTNGVGLNVSHSFGFGLMDAAAMVKLAKIWKPVSEQRRCQASSGPLEKLVPPHDRVILTVQVMHCDSVKFLEHVQARVTLDARIRGDIEIFLKSPSGTISTVLKRRPRDQSRVGFRDWPFMTTHNWGESPLGKWTLEVHNVGSFEGQVLVTHWSLHLYGVEQLSPLISATDPPSSSGRLPVLQGESGNLRSPSKSARHSHDSSVGFDPGSASVADWKVVMFGTEMEAGTAPSPGDSNGSSGIGAVTLPDRHSSTAGSSSAATTIAAPPMWRNIPGCVLGNPNTLSDCLECNSSMLLSSGHCVWRCPASTYRQLRSCLPCHYSCATCRDSLSCSECRAGDSLWPHSGLCVATAVLERLPPSSSGSGHSSETLLVAAIVLVMAVGMFVFWMVRRNKQREQQLPPSEVVAFTDEEDGGAGESSSEKSKLLENLEE